ncbi:hypothetical protein H8356DRAFT_1695110 [Neocallimastix lanati (nom. inval.)]|jgi:hypothetical protein|uniref:Cyclin-D1-binding protein 1-like N-terminal domain-containing protein n=1 Tax=Neocallimastix californiae TaxID=1754190 RepID=A0A1Y1WYV6_9FUNG|nr:hypothetical protein H8356DRAFT_1695110 [Neocallimastix sp. JGI-2020a]ORX78741.1 hypothetical protein LY90DRAFT_679774 [Neocallimastix californiae]|eukprot:ORX78741.1 hypothetical protein LY90DRAFT_679774 [Neocallimastix californiae]
MAKKTEQNLEAVLKKFVNKIINYIDDINNPNEKLFMAHDDFNHSVFFQRLSNAVSLISSNATKFSITAKPPCNPKDVIEITGMFSKSIENLVNIVESVPLSQGANYNKEIREITKELLRSVATLVNGNMKKPVNLNSIKSFQGTLIDTGITWYNCDAVAKLSKSNLEACSKKIKVTLDFIGDSMAEIKEASENGGNSYDDFDADLDSDNEDDDEEETKRELTENEKILLENSLNMFKMSNFLLKKILTRTMKQYINNNTVEANQWLDSVAENAGKSFSEATDDLACAAMSYPLDAESIAEECNHLFEKASNLIDVCIKVSDEINVKWYNTCRDQFKKYINAITALKEE